MVLPLQRSPSSSTNTDHIFTLLGATRQLRHHQTARETKNIQCRRSHCTLMGNHPLLHSHGKYRRHYGEMPLPEGTGDIHGEVPLPAWPTPRASLCLPDPWCSFPCPCPVRPLNCPSWWAVLTHKPVRTGQLGTGSRGMCWLSAPCPFPEQDKPCLFPETQNKLCLFPERRNKICVFPERSDKTLNLWMIYYYQLSHRFAQSAAVQCLATMPQPSCKPSHPCAKGKHWDTDLQPLSRIQPWRAAEHPSLRLLCTQGTFLYSRCLFSLNIPLQPWLVLGFPGFCLKTCTRPAWPRFLLLQHTWTPVRPLAFIKLLPKCHYMKLLLKIKIKNMFCTYCCLLAGEKEAKDARGTSLQPVTSLANVCPGLTPTDWRQVCCEIPSKCFTRSFFSRALGTAYTFSN